MSNFPTLKTGAVLQYPAQRSNRFSTTVLRFVDGSGQRFQNYPKPLRRWLIKLDLLDQAELHSLREFFRTQNGAAGSFSFTDPWDGTIYPTCSLGNDQMSDSLEDEMKSKTSLTVQQNRS